ncbi:chemotaxis protein CheA [Caldibacillus lycopersici]|uniref:Chemotaxis protein CheA n=1 Tax=Perspicuibacillus lycopersici TaxID=1325689 RepID=A0AAE3LP84_9BACI|nr:chemotaxis protein CheA [Perspicuibacillus lycopersici]MCU9612084.1 chemotaxis protein CheA [Perspicuibacillus lycopersici]
MGMDHYLEVFIAESREHIQTCNENLLQLEMNPENMEIVNEIFRSAHTLKGMSATMGFDDMTKLTHQMENVLDGIKNKKYPFSSNLLDIIFDAIDLIEKMVDSIATGNDGKIDVSAIVEKLRGVENQGSITGSNNEIAATRTMAIENETLLGNFNEFELNMIEESINQGFQVYSITVQLSDECMLKYARSYMVFQEVQQLGEIIKSDPSVTELEKEQFDNQFIITCVSLESAELLEQKIMDVSEVMNVTIIPINLGDLKGNTNNNAAQEQLTIDEEEPIFKNPEASKAIAKIPMNKTIRVNLEKLDVLMNLFEELIIDRGRLEQISQELNQPVLSETVEKITRVSSDLQSIILNIRMVAIETVFQRFPKMVRQLSRELHKKIHLELLGEDTELDRTVIDEIGDPLVHLIRNSIDHGIELPEERIKNGKPEMGTIQLKAYHRGNHVIIEISDDGSGINSEKVLAKAIAKGIIDSQQSKQLTEREIYDLIFTPGFSTADTVSDISGRGVGLDVVKNTIQSLGGSITVQSKEMVGTQFLIELPLTLTIISVLLVDVNQETYSIPLSNIVENIMLDKRAIEYVQTQPVFRFRNRVLPLIYLQEVFQVSDAPNQDSELSIVIIQKGEKLAGLVVSSFIGQKEVVIKSLGNYLSNVYGISGATILGDGQVSLIIDCNVLLD